MSASPHPPRTGTPVGQSTSTEIDAPIDVVWQVFSDVERWPTWTASIRSVELLDGALRVGARAKIRQPRLPTVVWTVTELEPGRSWTWEASGPGAHTVATHLLRQVGDSTVAEMSIANAGPVGRLMGRMWRSLTARYLAMESAGLKRRSEQLASDAASTA
jgi:uncharacterized membrane protein